MVLLTKEEFLATFSKPMSRVGIDEPPMFDFWPYFDAIAVSDFQGHDCSAGAVEYVWREASGRFEHVLIKSEDRNVSMVVVLDRTKKAVHGHCLLDLNREYGLSDASGTGPENGRS